MANERIGGTRGVVEKREDARRMVPSPPKVATRSVFEWRWLDVDVGDCVVEKMG